ncbi:MAG: trigger factor [Flavobacteriaceae bacterium]|nr:trigger factor [Flavobacteriaceae bacterium]
MQITKEQIDALNAVLTINLEKQDYAEKVDKVLSDYRKTANIPGFRKGHVPLNLVKKQYGKAVLVDEVNKLLQDALEKYLTEEKLDVLGNPLPKPQDNLDWNAEQFTFEFEIGLAPEFEIDLKPGKKVTWYKIVADEKAIEMQIANINKYYGKLVSQTAVVDNAIIKATVKNETHSVNAAVDLEWDELSSDAQKILKGAKSGDTLLIQAQKLFLNPHDLMHQLKLEHDQAHQLDVDLEITLNEVNSREAAELNQELFDKIFEPGKVNSEAELRLKLKEDFEKQLAQQSDQKLLNDMTEYLVEHTKFDLPAGFLQKWIQATGEKQMSDQEAEKAYQESEKALRFQLIEGKLVKDHALRVSYEELKSKAKELIAQQMAQFGQTDVDDAQLEEISNRILTNQDEAKRLSEQVFSLKMINFYKENCGLKEKEITYDDFIKEVYG